MEAEAIVQAFEEAPGVCGLFLPVSQGLLRAHAEVLERDNQEGWVRLRVLGHAVRLQRREYFRLENPDAKARYRLGSSPGEPDAYIPASMRNLSGDGVALVVPLNDLESGSSIHVEIELDDARIHAGGRIVQTALHVPHPGKATLRVQFVEIDEQDRARIIRFLFRRQADRRR
jgi:c-di-GMP-binding flagellar brake protein YcgR